LISANGGVAQASPSSKWELSVGLACFLSVTNERPMTSRRGLVLFALAVTIAAVLSLAVEHAWPQHLAGQPAESSRPDNKGTPQDHEGARERGSTGWTGGSRDQTKTKPGVGSRALTGQDQERAAGQPEMATGVDLKGPPVRLPSAKTPE